MIIRKARNLDSARSLLTIGIAGLLVMGVMTTPRAWSQSQTQLAPLPAFEVASVKQSPPGGTGLMSISPPGALRFTATNVSLRILMSLAFGVDDDRISGKPTWLDSERYDVAAKPEGERGLTYEELRPLLQQLLEQRFNLSIHREKKDSRGYALVVAKGGPKLQKSAGNSDKRYYLRNRLLFENVSLETLAAVLARPAGRPVMNKTGIQGNYDIHLDYAADGTTDSSLPSIFTALKEQLGLELVTRTVPVEIVVIDHVERVPTAN
jgi:uncharacterized protein (TIGR03435 family)